MLAIQPFPASPFSALDKADERARSSVARISSLRRLNSAADDAAGVAIAARLAAQITGNQAAERGLGDGQSLADTAEGGLSQVNDRMQRMRELALQAGNGSLNSSDRASLNREYRQLGAEVQRELGSTRFNGQAVLGDQAGRFEQSAGADPEQTVSVDTRDLRGDAAVQAVTQGSITDAAGAADQVKQLDQAQTASADLRSTLGAASARLAAAADNLAQQNTAGSAAYGRLMDTDLAQTSAQLRAAQTAQYAAIQQMLQMGQSRRGALLALLA